MCKVIFPCLAMYVDVINKDLQELVCLILKHFRHGSRKRPCCIFQPEWHHIPIIETVFCYYCCLFYVIWQHSDLPKAKLQIQCTEPLIISHLQETSSIKSIGNESLLVCMFNGLQSPHNHLLSSLLTCRLTLEAYLESLFFILPSLISA